MGMLSERPLSFDLHCHLDLYPNPLEAFQEAEKNRIFTITVTTTPKAWPQNRLWAQGLQYVHPALGLHPQLVASRASELGLFFTYLPEARFIGEVGLDRSEAYKSSYDVQYRVFDEILKGCQRIGGKILTIHSLQAVNDVLTLLDRNLRHSNCVRILHWFTGTPSEAKKAVELGCFFSFNSKMLKTDKGKTLLELLPNDRLLLETDGPFVKVGGKPAHPMDTVQIISEMAKYKQLSPERMQEILIANLLRIL